MRVLIDPVAPWQLQAYQAAADAHEQRQRGLLLTRIHGGEVLRTSVEFLPAHSGLPATAAAPAELLAGVLREEAVHYHRDATSHDELLIEPIVPRPLLLIVGGGHVGQALAWHAALAGFTIAVIDDRPEYADPALFPEGAITRTGDIAQALSKFRVDADTFIALVSRGHITDGKALAAVIDSPAGYIGMMGSRRKIALMRAEFIRSGRCTAEQFDRVHAPIGLDIGAQTVPEIAASIVAQLIAVWRRRTPTAGGWA